MQDVRRPSNRRYATNGHGVRSPFLFRVRLENSRRAFVGLTLNQMHRTICGGELQMSHLQ